MTQLSAISNQIGTASVNARLQEELQQQTRILELLDLSPATYTQLAGNS